MTIFGIIRYSVLALFLQCLSANASYHTADRLNQTYNPNRSISHSLDGYGYRLTEAITDTTGAVTSRYTWDTWGNLQQQTGISQQPFGFTGYQRDEQTGLYYAQQRYYDAEIGRFNRHDPFNGDINIPLSLHRYLYANANPTIFVDPTGEVGFLSTSDAFVDDTVANYDRQIEAAIAEGARGRAFTLGIGRGLTGLGGVVVGSLNATSNLLAINLGVDVEQATTELTQTQLALSDGIEVMDKTAKFIAENPAQAGAAVVVEGVEFSKAIMRGDAEAFAALGRGLGEGVLPSGILAKPLQTTAKATIAAARQAASKSGNVIKSATQAIRSEVDQITSVLRADGKFGRIDLSADLGRLSAFDRSSTGRRVLGNLAESQSARSANNLGGGFSFKSMPITSKNARRLIVQRELARGQSFTDARARATEIVGGKFIDSRGVLQRNVGSFRGQITVRRGRAGERFEAFGDIDRRKLPSLIFLGRAGVASRTNSLQRQILSALPNGPNARNSAIRVFDAELTRDQFLLEGLIRGQGRSGDPIFGDIFNAGGELQTVSAGGRFSGSVRFN